MAVGIASASMPRSVLAVSALMCRLQCPGTSSLLSAFAHRLFVCIRSCFR